VVQSADEQEDHQVASVHHNCQELSSLIHTHKHTTTRHSK